MAVLNELALAQRGNIEVHSDMLGIPLMSLDLEKGDIVSVANAHDFDAVVPAMRTRLNDVLAAELPDYNDLKEALYSSLLVPPDNLNDLMAEIRKSAKRKEDPYRYPQAGIVRHRHQHRLPPAVQPTAVPRRRLRHQRFRPHQGADPVIRPGGAGDSGKSKEIQPCSTSKR